MTIWKLLNAKDFIAMFFFVLLLSLLISFSSSCCHLVEEIAKIWFSTNYSLNNKQNLEYSAGDHEFIVFIATKSVWQFWHIQTLPLPCSIHNGWEIYSFESCHMKFYNEKLNANCILACILTRWAVEFHMKHETMFNDVEQCTRPYKNSDHFSIPFAINAAPINFHQICWRFFFKSFLACVLFFRWNCINGKH